MHAEMKMELKNPLTQLLNLRKILQNRLQEIEDRLSGLKGKVHDLDEINST